jgi:hypothetical protein
VIRYNFNISVTPPAPFVYVTISSRDGSRETGNVAAQLDTAADKTVVPWEVVQELRATPDGEIPLMGLGGQIAHFPTFFLHLPVHDNKPIAVEVVASPEEPHILLGRDVLNSFRILLDGPGLVLEID